MQASEVLAVGGGCGGDVVVIGCCVFSYNTLFD